MGFRFYRRVNLGSGLGLNLSKWGVSTTLRTKYGSFGSREDAYYYFADQGTM